MTRTKNRVFFIAPEANPSEFLLEIKQHYKNVKLLGEWNEEEPVSIAKKPCPICGYPMQFKYKKSYGLRLYICSNEPEICGFMTNDYRAGKLAIQKCEKCRDGYLVVKPGRDQNYFLGCTNYKPNGTGCNNTISKQAYYSMMGYKIEESDVDLSEKSSSGIVWGFSQSKGNVQEPEKNNTNSKPNPTMGFERKLKFDNSDCVDASETYQLQEEKNKEKKEWNSNKDDYEEIMRADVKPVLYKNMDLNVVIYNIVKVLQDISLIRFYGITILCDVIRGSNSKRVIDNDLNGIKGYGIYKKLPDEMLKTIIEWMISEHYILQTKGQYQVLHSTYEGLHYSETISERKLKQLRKELINKFGEEKDEKKPKKTIGEGFYLTEEAAQRFEYSDYYYIEEIRKELNRVMYRQGVKRLHSRELIAYLKSEGFIEENAINNKVLYQVTEKGKANGIVERIRKDETGLSYAILLYSQKIQRIIVDYFKRNERIELFETNEIKHGTSERINRKIPDNAGTKWTSAEDELLDNQFKSGMTISDIAKAHNRTNKAIRIRLQRHGLIEWNNEN